MQEFEQKILEQYDIEVSSTRKVRGAVLCETNKGLFLLKEITTSEKRIPALCELYTRLYEQGYHRIDYVVTNRNGEYISALDNGDRYILKKCFAGRECDIKKTREIFEAAGNLAKLHIIMTKEGIATTNFEKFRRDIQVEDLYYFLRKVLEKSGWKIRLGDGMLNAYSAIHPLTEGEMEYLKIRLIYPEKFWKTANSYYCTNKAWISVKNIEKLQTAIRQTEEKKMFLKEVFGFEL